MELNIHPPLPGRKDFRIGILGSGFIVNDCHLVAYRKAGFNPVAIASRNPANAQRVAQQHAIAKVYENYEQLLDDPTIEVLDIAVPPNAQLELIKAACERRTVKGILAQKPLGMNYAEAREAVECCARAGITLAVNQNMRYDHSVRAAKTLLENNTLGEPIFATIEMRAIPHWMPWQKDLGWLTLRIMSIHHLDTLRYWFGEPERIYCSVRTDPRTKFPHLDGICTYILEYKSGLRCVVIDDTWAGPAKEGCPSDNYIKWRIEGTNGLAIGDIGWCKGPFTSPSTIRYASKGDLAFHEPQWKESWFPDAFTGTMAQLLIALEDESEPAISGLDNLGTMALVEAAYQSAARFESVQLAQMARLLNQNGGIRTASAPAPPRPVGFFGRLLSSLKARSESSEKRKPYNFTPRAQQVFALARKEAERLNHNGVGPEHLMLGIMALGQGVAANVLRHHMGLDFGVIQADLEWRMKENQPIKSVEISNTVRLKEVLALGAKEQVALQHLYFGTEHILLGLVRDGDNIAAQVLKIDLEMTRQEVLKELDPNFGQ